MLMSEYGKEKMVEELKGTLDRIAAQILGNASAHEAFRDVERERAMKADFWTTTVGIVKPISSQGRSGRCWIFAGCNAMRVAFVAGAKKGDLLVPAEFEFSHSYLAFYDHLEKASWFLDELLLGAADLPQGDRLLDWLLASENLAADGGQWDMLKNLVNTYGVVPKEVFPETKGSHDTLEMKNLIRGQLRDAALKMRTSHVSRHDIAKSTLDNVCRILCYFIGVPPQKFSWRISKDKTLGPTTPQQFYQEFVRGSFDVDDFVCCVNAPNRAFGGAPLTIDHLGNHSRNGTVSNKRILYLNMPMEKLVDLCSQQLAAGIPIWMGCDFAKEKEKDSSLLDTKIFHYTPLLGHLGEGASLLTKGQRLEYGASRMTHAMLIVAKDEPPGGITRWKVENSHGSKKGINGYCYMSSEWMNEYVMEVAIHKKFLDPESVSMLNETPIVLPPWDPLGALAQDGA